MKNSLISLFCAALFFACTTDFDPGSDADVDVDAETDVHEDTPPETEPDTEDDETDPCDVYPVWYRDEDEDGYGGADDVICAASAPAGYVGIDGDCCDSVASVNPDQTGWFNVPYSCPDLRWDYNCDGYATLEFALEPCPDLESTCNAILDEEACRSTDCCYSSTESGSPLPECGTVASIWRCGWWAGHVPECLMSLNPHGGCEEYGGGGEQIVACH